MPCGTGASSVLFRKSARPQDSDLASRDSGALFPYLSPLDLPAIWSRCLSAPFRWEFSSRMGVEFGHVPFCFFLFHFADTLSHIRWTLLASLG